MVTTTNEDKAIESATPPTGGGMSISQAAEAFNVSVRSVERARFVMRRGIPELKEQIHAGNLNLGAAEKIAKLPRDRQLAELELFLKGGKPKRAQWDIEVDTDRIADMLNSMRRRWSESDKLVMIVGLRQMADQLAGIWREEDEDDSEEDDEGEE